MSELKPLLTMNERHRKPQVGIFLSGSGTNAERVLDCLAHLDDPPVAVTALVTDAPETSRAHELGQRFGIPVVASDIRRFYEQHGERRVSIATPSGQEVRQLWTDGLRRLIEPCEFDFAVFAGFVPLTNLTEDFPCLNVHPGDLTYTENGRRLLVGLHTIPIERAIATGHPFNVVVSTRNRGYRAPDKNLTIPRYLWFLSLAALINLVLDVGIAIKCGFRYRPTFRFRSPGFRQLLAIFLPCVFSTGVYRIHALVDSLIAASLGDGQLTILSYANMVVSLVNTIIIGNLTVYAFPKIVARMEDRDERAGQKALWDYSMLFQLAVCLLIAGFFAVGQEGIDLLFLHGKFSRDASKMVYIGSCVYLLGQENNIIRDLVYRYFFGKGNTKATFRNSVAVSCANLVLSLVLVQFLGLYGIILGTVLAGLLSLVMILGKMKKNYGLFPEFRGFLGQYLLGNLIMAVSILAVLALKKALPPLPGPAAIGLYGVATLAIFLLTAYLFRAKALQVRL